MTSTESRDEVDASSAPAGVPTDKEVESVTIRFAGDSGDGIQVTGGRFSTATALAGQDLATLPDFPAEIRAPAGSLPGVSGFQVHFGSQEIHTPGDWPQVLVAMNPAALKTNLGDLERGGTVIVNVDTFTNANLKKAGYEADPLDDGTLDSYQVHKVALTSLTLTALEEIEGLSKKEKERAKNMFALGLVSWMYTRPLEPTKEWISQKFAGKDEVIEANLAALKAGWNYGETMEAAAYRVTVRPAKLPPGRYRQINGNTATAYGLLAASRQSGLPLFFGSYPITPASDVLHELSRHTHLDVRTFQAEDEIAGVGAALGAAYGGWLGATATSGPGLDLKAETIGLAVALELPLLIIDVQRAGPSTGMPTKTEQADLLQALFGRHGEGPVPVLAPARPGDCFDVTVEAARIALRMRIPVIVLSDGYLANGAEPWQVPDLDALPDLRDEVAFEPPAGDGEAHVPYARDADTLARPWAIPGTPGQQHRIGGLEKDDAGDISYDPANHHRQTEVRHRRVAKVADMIPPFEVDDPSGSAELLVLGWGSTEGAIKAAVERARADGAKVARGHLRHLNPFPHGLDEAVAGYRRVLVPEINMGQLQLLVRGRLDGVDPSRVVGLNRVTGLPFTSNDIWTAIEEQLDELRDGA